MRQFNKWEDVGHWISEHLATDDELQTYSEIKRASYFFFARQESDMISDMSGREQAVLIMDGVKPLFDDEARVTDLLSFYYEDEAETDEEVNEHIHKLLSAHFGINH